MTSPHAPDAGQDIPGRRPARSGPRRRRRLRTALVLLAALLVAVVVDAAVVAARVDRVDVELTGGPGDSDGRTWVLVGLDSRAALPEGADVRDFGTPEAVPGARADVVVVVHQTDAGTTVLSVPRDVVVRTDRRPSRLALTWRQSPATMIAGLCQLGIPTDHLLTVDLAGFAGIVDAAHGLHLDIPQPVRDVQAGLQIDSAGRQRVDGATALALVRSRHPEHLVDGTWRPAPIDPDGRATAAGAVLSALVDEAQRAVLRPWRLQGVAWATSGALASDPATSFAELTSLIRADLDDVRVLPVSDPVGSTLARLPTADTAAALAAAGLACDD
ncbi:LCP family protein [Blastococcus sp. SYSU DS0619]